MTLREENKDDPFAEFGQSFTDIETAENNILSAKNTNLENFKKLVAEYLEDPLIGNSDCLLKLENLYYEIYVDNTKPIKINRIEFENYLSIYFMKILVDNNIANWKVVKNPFSKGNYNLAIEFDSDNWTTGGYATELYEHESNSSRKYLSDKLNEFIKK